MCRYKNAPVLESPLSPCGTPICTYAKYPRHIFSFCQYELILEWALSCRYMRRAILHESYTTTYTLTCTYCVYTRHTVFEAAFHLRALLISSSCCGPSAVICLLFTRRSRAHSTPCRSPGSLPTHSRRQ